MLRRTILGMSLAMPFLASAQTMPEKTKVTIGVGGKATLYYLPLTIAEQRGYFKQEGLEVEIVDFAGGAKSLQALVGGSVDVVTGAYEHTIRMQAKNQDIVAAIELGRYPAITIGVRSALKDKVKTIADLKGMKVGVSAPGSSTMLVMQYALVKAGLAKDDVSFIGVGTGASAVAAMKSGNIDAISMIEPVVTKLVSDGDMVILADTRTQKDTESLFGGTNPAAVMYLKRDYMEKNPQTTQRLVNALMKSLKWLEKSTPEEVLAILPAEYALGDKPLFIKAIKASLESYSRSGILSSAGMKSMYDALKLLDPEMANTNVDLFKTFNPNFAAKAQEVKP